MASNNQVDYFVTIDSEFRDNEKYPIETDFAVKFKETTSITPFVKGVPVNNSFFSDLQIDPNFVNSDFRVLGGTISNLKRVNNSFYLCGLIKALPIFQIQQKINGTYVNLGGTSFDYPITSVYLAKVNLVSGLYVFDWLIYLDVYDPMDSRTNITTSTSFSFDNNNNIYWTFDFSIFAFNLYKKDQTLSGTLLYSVENPSPVDNACMAVFVFTETGENYYVDGHNWGYHIIETIDDTTATESNGRVGIKVDNALDIYVSGNTNPYEPTLSETLVANGTTENVYQLFVYKNLGGDDCLLSLVHNSGFGGVTYLRARTYSIDNDGLTQLTTSTANYPFAGSYYTGTEYDCVFQYGNIVYIISTLTDVYGSFGGPYIYVSSVNLNTGVLTMGVSITNYNMAPFIYYPFITNVKYLNTVFSVLWDYSLSKFDVIKLDLTNIPAGYSLVASSASFTPLTGLGYTFIQNANIDNNIVHVTFCSPLGETVVFKGTVTATTFSFDATFLEESNLIPEAIPLSLLVKSSVFYKDSKYYLVLGFINDKIKTYIYDITDLTNPILESTINSLSTLKNILYVKGTDYFLLDSVGDIYTINDIENPILLSGNYPIIDDTETNTLYTLSSQYDKEFSNLIKTDLAIDKSFIASYPFLAKSVFLNSIHYNKNTENELNNTDIVTFEVVNQQNFSTTTVPTNTFFPGEYSPLLWLDASLQSTVIRDGSNNVSQWNDNSGNGRNVSSPGSQPYYDEKNRQIIFDNTYMEGLFGGSFSPKYMVAVSKQWNELTNQYDANCLVEIGDSANKLGFYKYRNDENNIKSYVTSFPATSQSYTFTSSSDPALTNTGKHPYLFTESYNTNYTVSSTTQYLVALGANAAGLGYSLDGTHWFKNNQNIFTTYGRNAQWNDTICVAVGEGTNSIAYSSDGLNWTGLGTSIFDGFGLGVVYSDTLTRWVSGGQGSIHTLAYSANGIVWTGIGNTIFTTRCNNIYWNGSLFMAVGTGTNNVAYSTDGIFWTSNNISDMNEIYDVIYLNNESRWIVVGDGTSSFAYSDDDGLTWTTLGKLFLTTSGYSLDVNQQAGLVVAGGQGSTYDMCYSYDGINWTSISTSIFDDYCRGVTYDILRGIWYASGATVGGATSVISYSTNGINWTGVNNDPGYGGYTFYPICFSVATPISSNNSSIKYSKGIFEVIYEEQSTSGVIFNGEATQNNVNYNINPVNSTGWNDVPVDIRIGSSSLSNNFYRGTVNYSTYSNALIYVNGNSGSINSFNGSISEIIVYDTVPSLTVRKQLQAYLAKKWNLWNLYSGSNPYKPVANTTTNLVSVDGTNMTYLFNNFNDVVNVNSNDYTLPLSIVNYYNDTYNLFTTSITHQNVIQFKKLIYNSNIYLFFCFTNGTDIYLSMTILDSYYTYIYSTYSLLTTYGGGTSLVPVQNIIPYEDGGIIYCLVQFLLNPRELRRYSYIPNSYISFTLDWTNNVPLDGSVAPVNYPLYWQTSGEVVKYATPGFADTIILYIGVTINDWDFLGGARGDFYSFDISGSSFTSIPNDIPISTLKIGSNKNGMSRFDYPNGNIYIFLRTMWGNTNNFSINVTDYNNLTYDVLPGWSGYPIYDVGPSRTNFPCVDNEVPNSIFQHPVTKQIYYLENTNPTNFSDLFANPPPTPLDVQQYFTYRNYTNLNSVPGANAAPITPINLGYRVSIIKHAISGQKVFAALLITDSTALNTQYIKFYDVTNPVYATEYYQTASPFATASSVSYTGLNGIGLGFINKLSNIGESQWVNYVGGDSSSYPSINVNIANIDLTPDLSELYLCGGWKYKIESFNVDNTKANKIYNISSGYNGYLAKVTLKDGNFSWLLPTFGSGNDYIERLNHIDSKNLVGLVCHFESPVLLVYQPQISVPGGPFTNPNVVNLNLANTSSESSALITFTNSGSIQYSCKLFSLLDVQSIELFDLVVDEDSTKKRIYVTGLTNATQINSTDSTGIETQKMYNDINQLTQQSLIIYSYDLDGIYLDSQKSDLPSQLTVNISDIKSFSLLNRFATFLNVYSLNTTTNEQIEIFNPDGSIASKLTSSDDFLYKKYVSLVTQYYYDNTYVDVNGNTYSRIINPNSVLPTTTNELVNYNLFIQGDLFDSTVYTDTGETLVAPVDPLNQNFSIRGNFVDTNGKYNIILNQVIPLKTLERKNLPGTLHEFWSGSAVKSTLNDIIAYDMTLVPNVSNTLTITNLYGTALSTTAEYYIMIPVGSTIRYITVTNVNYNTTTNTYTMTIANLNDLIVNGNYYGPYLYLGIKNLNANYTIQFCPTPLNTEARFKIKLNSLIIPNRRIKNSYLGGSRDLNDFRYLILEVYNENSSEQFSETINSNDFFNNPAYISYINRCKGTFTLPITGINVASTSNFILLNSIDIPIVTFLPGYYNIHIKLKDIYGNVVQFDSTPITDKQSDSIFDGSSVDSPLMQITANLTFTKI